jgi:hypothetical protein
MPEFNSLRDLHDFILILIEFMKSIGEDISAAQLQDAMSQQQRSEWLGEINIALRKIRKEHAKDIPKQMIKEIDRAINSIDIAFKRANSPFFKNK